VQPDGVWKGAVTVVTTSSAASTYPFLLPMLGRILTHLKRRGRLVEPPRSGLPGSRRALWLRPRAVRKWDVVQAYGRSSRKAYLKERNEKSHPSAGRVHTVPKLRWQHYSVVRVSLALPFGSRLITML
jgi:hypothetical protein